MTKRIVFLQEFKATPWQIIDKLQVCYDNGDDIIKMSAFIAAKEIDRYVRTMSYLLNDSMENEEKTMNKLEILWQDLIGLISKHSAGIEEALNLVPGATGEVAKVVGDEIVNAATSAEAKIQSTDANGGSNAAS